MRQEIISQTDKSKGSIRMHPKALTPLTRVSPDQVALTPPYGHKSRDEPRTEEKEEDKKCYKFRRECQNGREQKRKGAIVSKRNFEEFT
ncbi:hypothetical protein WN48_05342 [Eufriesea mexicana]|nr:hypothetical protein WN48_05342 [Eufriesea mexicana]